MNPFKQDTSKESKYEHSYYQGYTLLTYVLINLAWVKYEELVEDVQELARITNANKNRGKGSLELKIEKKLQAWKQSSLFNIRTTLQKYSCGFEVLHTNEDKISKISSMLEGMQLYWILDIDLYEQCEDGQMQIQVDESSAIIAERDMKMYISELIKIIIS